MHIVPFEAAKEIRPLLRELFELVSQPSVPANIHSARGFLAFSDKNAERAVGHLEHAHTHLINAAAARASLMEVVKTRRVSAIEAEVRNLLNSVDVALQYLTSAQRNLGSPEKADDTVRYRILQVKNLLDKTNGGDGSTEETRRQKMIKKVRRARVLAQAFPTNPANALSPAETVVNALVAIMTNFKYVTPVSQESLVEGQKAITVSMASVNSNLEFEDNYGMSKDEWIAEHGDLPSDWEDPYEEGGE
jgi:hypothetical protein